MIEDSRNKIEDIKRNLYDPNDKSMGHQREGILHQISHKVNEEWKNDDIKIGDNMNKKFKKPPMSIFKKFFLASIIFFVGALGLALSLAVIYGMVWVAGKGWKKSQE